MQDIFQLIRVRSMKKGIVKWLHITHIGAHLSTCCMCVVWPPFFNVSTYLFLRGEQVRVDHVWVKAQALVTSSGEESATRVRELTLIPRNMDSRYWCDEFQLSDHRPLYACINIDITKPQ